MATTNGKVDTSRVTITPETLDFNVSMDGPDSSCALIIKNDTSAPLAFKVKTTAPKRYLVKPNQGLLMANTTESIQLLLLRKDSGEIAAQMDRDEVPAPDKFLVQIATVSDTTTKQLGMLQKGGKEHSDALGLFWSGAPKDATSQRKLITSFKHVTGAAAAASAVAPGGDAAGSNGQEPIAIGPEEDYDKRKSPEGLFQEMMILRRKYDDLVAFTVNLTAERDVLNGEIANQTKALGAMPQAARPAGGAAGGGDSGDAAAARAWEDEVAEKGSKRFGLAPLVVVAVLSFGVGRYVSG